MSVLLDIATYQSYYLLIDINLLRFRYSRIFLLEKGFVMKYRPIIVDNAQQELTQHGTKDFPLSMDRQNVCAEGILGVRHWHYEIQIILMAIGSAVFATSMGEYELKEGDGLFINSGVLHEAVSAGDESSTYICVNFTPEMVCGNRDSAIFQDYVNPILTSTDMQSFRLSEEGWQGDVLSILKEMGKVEDAHEYAYELDLNIKLLQIWYLIVQNNRFQVGKKATASFADRLRLRQLKQFIHEHYMERLTLEDIAGSIALSRSELCRLFKRTEGRTPIGYLKAYRLSQSVKMLRCTDLSIAEIGYQCGFDSSSYFISCFRREMGATPLEYRSFQSETTR